MKGHTHSTKTFFARHCIIHKVYYIGHLDSIPKVPRRKEGGTLLPNSPHMTNEVLNNALESLLFTDEPIPPLEPVLQHRTGPLRGLLQFLNMRFQL